jgi:dihydroflavonol-4-reductase
MNGSGKVLVTGASGFVGSAVARKLVERGFAVRALVRPTSPRFHLAGLDLEFAEGDLRDAETVRSAMAGVRYLFHIAADYRLWAPDRNEIVANNLNSTKIVMEAALRAGAERIVYTSSVATLAVRMDGTSVDETFPLDEAKAIGAYKRSKVVAERLVERMIAEEKLPAVIVNPSTPIGPRDVKPTPTGRIIVEAAHGRIPAFVDTGLNLVHVDDVADGHLAALDRGTIGERYILGGQNVQFAEMLAVIAGLVGRRAPRLRMPRGPLIPLALAAETIARFTKREPFVTRDALKMSRYRMFFTTAKAERVLGVTARPFTEALADAIGWFRGAGYIKS